MNNWRNLIYPSRPDALLWRRGLLPTTALYFLNACADWIADGLVEQTGTNSFRTSRANLVIRQDLPEAVGQALDDRSRKLVYLVDDHVAAHASDVGLPENYRARLADRWQRVFQPLLRRASAIVVCSDYLLHHLLPYGPTLRTDPVWHRRLFEGLEQKLSAPALPGRVQVAVLGTGSHQAELGFLVPVLAGLLAARGDVDLILPGGPRWPEAIAGHPQVRLRWPVPWSDYEQRLSGERFDLCLYPTLDTPFAAGRSRNKLTEQALTGAFGLFSESWLHADAVPSSGAGALAANTPEAWLGAAQEAIDGLPVWRSHAAEVGAAIRQLNDPGPQRELWRDLLGVETGF